MITFNPDKFGYYQVGNKTTFSKLEAAEWAGLNNQEVVWKFNDEVFSAINWKQEPDTSLWEMYKDRARQIRAAYDYVVLWYSGGSDSHNMLCAWIEAGLKIDEIATTWNYEATGDWHNHYNAEITNVVMPDIKTLQDKGIEFKFRAIDISQYCIDLFDVWGNEFEYNVNCHFSPNNPARGIFREKIEDYKNLIAEGKKLCFVWGKEKPMIGYDSQFKRHYLHFADNSDNCVGPYVQKNYWQGWYDEFFYWTPDYPLIPVKQAHVIKNFIELTNDQRYFSSDKFTVNGYSPRFNGYLPERFVKLLLYPKWNDKIFCNGKTSSFTYSMRDEWFFKSNLDLTRKFISITNSYFNRIDPDDKTRKFIRPYQSKRYYL
jgi:hypothetical protein